MAVANEVTVTEANGEVLLLAKRQAPEGPIVGCLLYRYGTFAADLDIVCKSFEQRHSSPPPFIFVPNAFLLSNSGH